MKTKARRGVDRGPLFMAVLYVVSVTQSTTDGKHQMKNARKKQFINLSSRALLGSVITSGTVLPGCK